MGGGQVRRGRQRGGGGRGEGGRRGGGGGRGGFFPKKPLCPVRNRLWSMSTRGVGGLALHGKAAGVPPPTPPPPREKPVRHAAKVGGPSTLNPQPSTLNPKP